MLRFQNLLQLVAVFVNCESCTRQVKKFYLAGNQVWKLCPGEGTLVYTFLLKQNQDSACAVHVPSRHLDVVPLWSALFVSRWPSKRVQQRVRPALTTGLRR